MKFLHEYLQYADGTKKENGYWEIQGKRLVNRNGGYHYYNPSDDDEIIEADSWRDILKISIRYDNEITGWIAPDGEFIGCLQRDHDLIANILFDCDEMTLTKRGYIKIYEIPKEVRIMMLQNGEDAPRYEAIEANAFCTEAQRKMLENKGFVNKNGYFWVMT